MVLWKVYSELQVETVFVQQGITETPTFRQGKGAAMWEEEIESYFGAIKPPSDSEEEGEKGKHKVEIKVDRVKKTTSIEGKAGPTT